MNTNTGKDNGMKSSTRSRPCTANLAAALALSAANALAYIDTAEKAVVRTGEIMTIEIAADTTWDKPVFVDGVLRKTGSGKLTIAGEKLYGHGRIEVADGEHPFPTPRASAGIALES